MELIIQIISAVYNFLWGDLLDVYKRQSAPWTAPTWRCTSSWGMKTSSSSA